ncbi:MAG TPA: hypothetical protein VNR65_01305, partial [Geobacterales bacterium]|nr:hypothetical protein [Geobacterales bacterium]
MVRIGFAVRVAFCTSLLLSTETQAQEAGQQSQPQGQAQQAQGAQKPQTLPPVVVKNARATKAKRREFIKKKTPEPAPAPTHEAPS